MTNKITLTNTQLKIIAVLSMLIDHICLTLFPESQAAYIVRLTVGRVAMPIFAFLLCEGFFNTKNRFRYGLKLIIFAIISEPVFDLLLFREPFSLEGQNILFTLALGLIMLCVLQKLEYSSYSLLQYPVLAGFIAASWFLRLDHDIAAIAVIAIFYYFHWHKIYVPAVIACAGAAVINGTPGILIAILPLCLYNHERGRINTFFKYFFYGFYPLHILVLVLIRYYLKI